MERKLKHLEMIQGVISRLNLNSFRIKGWAAILVTALLALFVERYNMQCFYVPVLLVIVLWGLDGFYLWQETKFRNLYDTVRNKRESDIDFAMDVSVIKTKKTWLRTTFCSMSLLSFYITLILLSIFLSFIGGKCETASVL